MTKHEYFRIWQTPTVKKEAKTTKKSTHQLPRVKYAIFTMLTLFIFINSAVSIQLKETLKCDPQACANQGVSVNFSQSIF
jgi:hypothetical protein